MTKWKNVHEKKAEKQTKMASKQRWIYNSILQVFLKYLLLCTLHTEIIIKAVNSICFLYQGKLPYVWESGGLRSVEGVSRGSPRTPSWLAFCLQGPLHFPTAIIEWHPLPQLSSHHLALNSLLFGFGPSPPVRQLSKAPSILSVALMTFSWGWCCHLSVVHTPPLSPALPQVSCYLSHHSCPLFLVLSQPLKHG